VPPPFPEWKREATKRRGKKKKTRLMPFGGGGTRQKEKKERDRLSMKALYLRKTNQKGTGKKNDTNELVFAELPTVAGKKKEDHPGL